MATGMRQNLPFKVGEEIEVRSFDEGYRGAWFRCKINEIRIKGVLEYCLEYHDFPGEKPTWTKSYEAPPNMSKKELMVRPPFPSFHKESEMSEQDPATATDVKVVVTDEWRVGGSVDLWYDYCYWSGKITKFVDDDLVEVELPESPIGEGGLYHGPVGNLRPALHWSPEKGWTVAISTEKGESWYAARVINTRESGAERVSEANHFKSDSGGKKETPSCFNAASNTIVLSDNDDDDSKANGNDHNDDDHHKANGNDHNDDDDDSKANGNDHKDDDNGVGTPGCSSSKPFVKQHDTIDLSIMQLEELAIKIRWIKGLVKHGLRWSDDMKPSWKFEQKN